MQFDVNDAVRVTRRKEEPFEDVISSITLHREPGKPEEIRYYFLNHDDEATEDELIIIERSPHDYAIPEPLYLLGEVVKFDSKMSDRHPDFMEIRAIDIILDRSNERCIRYYPTSNDSEHLDWVDEEDIECAYEPKLSACDKIAIKTYCRPGETVEAMMKRMTQ